MVFTPVTTLAELLRSRQPPRALIAHALPVTLAFTAASALCLTALYRPRWPGAVAIMVTACVIVLFLGMNISILGLVVVPRSAFHVLAEVMALLVTLALTYASTMVVLDRSSLVSSRADG